jgi:hypothetical protein
MLVAGLLTYTFFVCLPISVMPTVTCGYKKCSVKSKPQNPKKQFRISASNLKSRYLQQRELLRIYTSFPFNPEKHPGTINGDKCNGNFEIATAGVIFNNMFLYLYPRYYSI